MFKYFKHFMAASLLLGLRSITVLEKVKHLLQKNKKFLVVLGIRLTVNINPKQKGVVLSIILLLLFKHGYPELLNIELFT